MSRVQAVLQVDVPIHELFAAPTVAKLAYRVEQALATKKYGAEALSVPLVPVPRTPDLPLSFAQRRLWLLEQLEPGNSTYLAPVVWRMRGPLHIAHLDAALAELVQRHELLS